MISVSLCLMALTVTHALNIGRGYNSRCFENAVDASFASPASRGKISVGVTAIVESKFANLVNRALIQRTLDTANVLWARAGVEFADLQVVTSNSVSDTRGGQHEGFTSYMRPVWQREADKYPDRLAIVFSQVRSIRSVTTGGVQYHGVGGFAGRAAARRSFIWMNVDARNRRRAPLYTDRTLQHELGHAIGLFHTFQADFGCQNNDWIADTPIAPQSFAGCNARLAACDGQTKVRDMENLMSYGSCRGAKKVTPGQMRRVRCAFENHIPWRVLSGSRTAPPNNRPSTPPTPSRPPRRPRPPTPPRLPGVGSRCLGSGYRGVCYNQRTHRCTSGYILRGACAGPAHVTCCILAPIPQRVEEMLPALTISSAEETIPDDDVFELPAEFAVYQVGDTVTVAAHVAMLNPKIYLLRRTEIHLIPSDEELAVFGEHAGAAQSATDVFTYTIPLDDVDRGSYAIWISGEEVDASNNALGPRSIISEVFVVDVNSCVLTDSSHNVPYGLVRTRTECDARQGTVDHTVNGDIVCCAPEKITTSVEVPAEPTEEEMEMMSSEEMGEDVSHVTTTPPPVELGVVEWTGATSFWGAPMTVNFVSKNEDFALHMIQAGSEATVADNLPAAVFDSTTSGASATFTPEVAVPMTAVFVTPDLNGHTESFSVVSLPCRMADNTAGYCRPTQAITALGGTTPAELICANGEAAQCANLSVGSTTFACCAGSASALQQAAVYRAETSDLDMEGVEEGEETAMPINGATGSNGSNGDGDDNGNSAATLALAAPAVVAAALL